VAAAGLRDRFFAGVLQHGHAGQPKRICAGEVHCRAAGGHAAKVCGLHSGDDPAIPSSAGAGKMFDWNARELFQPVFGPRGFVAQASVIQIGEVRMRLRMAADLDSERAQAAYLRSAEISGLAKKADRDVRGSAKTKFFEQWRGREQWDAADDGERGGG